MLLDFESAFFKRNNSEHSVHKSLNTTTVKKQKTTREKRNKKIKSQYQEINVMACLKSRMYPVEQEQKGGRLEKFKSFQLLEPIGRIASIKQLTDEGKGERLERIEKR